MSLDTVTFLFLIDTLSIYNLLKYSYQRTHFWSRNEFVQRKKILPKIILVQKKLVYVFTKLVLFI